MGLDPTVLAPNSSHGSRASQLQVAVCCRPLMSTRACHREGATRMERLASGTFSVPEGHGVGEGGRWELPGGERTPGGQKRGNRCGCSTGGGSPEQGRPQPVGVGVSGRLQGVPGWQRGWLLLRGRATFSDEFDAGGQGERTPRFQSCFSWAMSLSAPGHTPQGSISGVAGRVCQPPPQARMGNWGSRLAGQGGAEGPCTEAPPTHTPTKEVLCAPSKHSESREGL